MGTKNLPTLQGLKLPAVFTQGTTSFDVSDLAGGVVAGFPVISYRGKVWRVRKAGKEEAYTDAEDNAMPYIEVVILKGSPHLSKLWYAKQYDSGDTSKPDCWSADGIKPDPAVPNPQSKSCAVCKRNEWGSKITPSGTKTRECSDHRRVAVAFSHELAERGADAGKYLLRIPPASLALLKEYAEKLGSKGIPYCSVVTRIGFDKEAEYPKLTFKPVGMVSDEDAAIIVALRDDDDTARIISQVSEFTSSGDGDEEDDGVSAPSASAPLPATEAPKKAPKPLPVEEEDFDEDDEDDEDEDEDEEEAPPPPPKKVKKAKKSKKVVAEPVAPSDDDEDDSEAKAPGSGSFDDMLDSLLGATR